MVDPDEEIMQMLMRFTMQEVSVYFRQGLRAALADLVVNGRSTLTDPTCREVDTADYGSLDRALDDAKVKHEVLQIRDDGKTVLAFEKADTARVEAVVEKLITDGVLAKGPIAVGMPEMSEERLTAQLDDLRGDGVEFESKIDDDGLVTMTVKGKPVDIAKKLGIGVSDIVAVKDEKDLQMRASESIARAKEKLFEPGSMENVKLDIAQGERLLLERLSECEIPYRALDGKAKEGMMRIEMTQEGAEAAGTIASLIVADGWAMPDAYPFLSPFEPSGPSRISIEVPKDMAKLIEDAAKEKGVALERAIAAPDADSSAWLGEGFKRIEQMLADEDETIMMAYEITNEDWSSLEPVLDDLSEQESLPDEVRTQVTIIRNKGRAAVNANQVREPVARRIESARAAEKDANKVREAKTRNREFVLER